MISGHPFIKKSGKAWWLSLSVIVSRWNNNLRLICSIGWRKISFCFNLSYEIRDKTIEFGDNRNVPRAEFVIRAYMQYGFWLSGITYGLV